MSEFLIAEEVAERERVSLRVVHEWLRLGMIPARKLPGTRRWLFRIDELQAFEDGALLETVDLPNGGRHIRPITAPALREVKNASGGTKAA